MLLTDIKNVVSAADKRELRKFGITIGVFLLIVSAFFFWREKSFAQYIAYTGAGFLIVGLTFSTLLKPVYIVWMTFAVIMGFIMTRVILTLFYSIVFVPAGLIIRLIGKDPLKEKIDTKAESYWIIRERGNYEKKSHFFDFAYENLHIWRRRPENFLPFF